MTSIEDRLCQHLDTLYGPDTRAHVWPRLETRITNFQREHAHLLTTSLRPENRLDEQDTFLISYGDHVIQLGQEPLAVLKRFLDEHVQTTISGVHLLPFFPYSSDDGFAVIDHRRVNPDLGNWAHVHNLSCDYRLMVDAVINHVSRQSTWFRAFCRQEPPYDDYFITVDPSLDLSNVERPRATPLLTPVETSKGTRHVWTTFSRDQVDLNFKNPDVLLEIVDILLFYLAQGANVIRLDAIAYLWKEIGTSCIHLPETHEVVKLLRAVLDAAAPEAILITETNVPHADNVSYFGDGTNEAQMVYNFALPPLLLHTFHSGSTQRLSRWVQTHLTTPSEQTAFFNFTASHDGIGLMPVRNILNDKELNQLIERTHRHGGEVSYKTTSDGSQSVYELNITYFDALNDPNDPQPDLDVRRFMASQAIMLSLPGVPGIYMHSLLGSRNCDECVKQTGHARSINRERLHYENLTHELNEPNSLRYRVLKIYTHLLRVRQSFRAFHPNADHEVVHANAHVFALIRKPLDGGESPIVCLVNVADRPQSLRIDTEHWGLPSSPRWHDLIGERVIASSGTADFGVELAAYQAMWLHPITP